jgi:hypothetical protein
LPAPKPAGRAIWVSIGNDDHRVDTDLAIAFTRAVVTASAEGKQVDPIVPVKLIVGPSAGHHGIENAHELMANWIARQLDLKAQR